MNAPLDATVEPSMHASSYRLGLGLLPLLSVLSACNGEERIRPVLERGHATAVERSGAPAFRTDAIELTDAQGRRVLVRPDGIRFFGPNGEALGVYLPRGATPVRPRAVAQTSPRAVPVSPPPVPSPLTMGIK